MKHYKTLGGVALLAATGLACAVTINGNNQQKVSVTGGAVNMAIGAGSKATMNLASNTGSQVMGSNSQSVNIKGVVVNSATNGASSTLNVASKTRSGSSGNQHVQINGAVFTTATGRGVHSEVNLGGK
jgi:hypothetical protein